MALDKKSAYIPGLTELAAGGAIHLAQNTILNGLMARRKIGPILENRIFGEQKKLKALKDGVENMAVPELGILEDEAVRPFKDISQKGYKERVLATHVLKGNWSRIANTKNGKKMIAKIMKDYIPSVSPLIEHLKPEEIKELENIYRKNLVGTNMIDIADRLAKHKNLPENYQRSAKLKKITEFAANAAMLPHETVGVSLNAIKRIGAADIQNLKKSSKIGKYKLAKKLIDKTQKLQDIAKERLVKRPLENTFENMVTNDSNIQKKDKLKRLFHTVAINGIVGSTRNLEADMLSAISKRHPELISKYQLAKKIMKNNPA